MVINCPKCKMQIENSVNFCPSCGQKIEHEPKALPTGQVIKIYVLSAILSPLGIYWFIKYFRDPLNNKVAYIAVAITLATLIIGTVLSMNLIKSIENTMSSYGSDLMYLR